MESDVKPVSSELYALKETVEAALITSDGACEFLKNNQGLTLVCGEPFLCLMAQYLASFCPKDFIVQVGREETSFFENAVFGWYRASDYMMSHLVVYRIGADQTRNAILYDGDVVISNPDWMKEVIRRFDQLGYRPDVKQNDLNKDTPLGSPEPPKVEAAYALNQGVIAGCSIDERPPSSGVRVTDVTDPGLD